MWDEKHQADHSGEDGQHADGRQALIMHHSHPTVLSASSPGAAAPLLLAWRAGHWPTLLGAWLHFEISFMVWLLLAALAVPITDELALSATQQGLLVAVPLLGGGLSRILIGLATDSYGPKRLGLVLLFVQLVTL